MTQADVQSRAASVSFRQLKLFESIGRLESVRRASEECNLSQPAVTQALAKLEQQIGVTLVDRRASGSYLNELGRLFHARVGRFFEQVESALTDLGVPGGASAATVMARRISRTQVRTLIAIVENGSFPQAAVALDLSQASLQRAARDLEGNLHKPLFHRTAAGVMVTPDGITLGRRLKLAAQEIEWGIRELEATRGVGGSRIVIGAMPFGGSVLLAATLDEFLRTHPQADVRVDNGGSPEMMRSLRVGDVDLVVGLLPETLADDLVSEALVQTPYSVVARRGHPLLRKGKVTVDDLRSADWVVGNTGASRRACFDLLFGDAGGPRASLATCSRTIVRHLLAQSDRLTLMTSYELMHHSNSLTAVPFGPILPAPSIGVTMRANWMPTAIHVEFIEMLRHHVAKGMAQPLLRRAS